MANGLQVPSADSRRESVREVYQRLEGSLRFTPAKTSSTSSFSDMSPLETPDIEGGFIFPVFSMEQKNSDTVTKVSTMVVDWSAMYIFVNCFCTLYYSSIT